VQLGLSMRDLDTLTIGCIYDMIIEKENDSFDYPYQATQADFDNF
jgi:hypothetical protein